jgi:hypothetical protein
MSSNTFKAVAMSATGIVELRADAKTNKNISKRFAYVDQRLASDVRHELDKWWEAARPLFAEQNTPGKIRCPISGLEIDGDLREEFEKHAGRENKRKQGGSRKAEAVMQRDEYEDFYKRLVWAFNNDDTDDNDISPSEVLVALEVDWENDSRGTMKVDRQDDV